MATPTRKVWVQRSEFISISIVDETGALIERLASVYRDGGWSVPIKDIDALSLKYSREKYPKMVVEMTEAAEEGQVIKGPGINPFTGVPTNPPVLPKDGTSSFSTKPPS